MGLALVAISITGLGIGFYFGMLYGEREAAMAASGGAASSKGSSLFSMVVPMRSGAGAGSNSGAGSGSGSGETQQICANSCSTVRW